jgi:FtsH-binding integral membrane protein
MQFNRGFQSAGVTSSATDAGLRAYMLKVYNLMALALALTGLVAFAASSSDALMQTIYTTPLRWVVMLAPLGIVFYLSARLNKMSASTAQTWFWTYAALMGVSLSYIFLAYTGASVARAFFITSGAFAGLSLYGYTTKKDLSGMRSFLMMGLIGIILAGVVNMFLASSALHFGISVIGVLVFAGLTAYDTQNIKESYYVFGGTGETGKKMAIMGALRLYLDFINLLIIILQFTGSRR